MTFFTSPEMTGEAIRSALSAGSNTEHQ